MPDIAQHLPQQTKTVEAIYAHYKKAGDDGHMFRTLPVSLIGHECERYLWYVFRQCCKPNFSGRMYRLFETGELEEARFTKNLRDIGCTVSDIDEATGKQHKVTAFGGHLKGYMDSAILGIPEAPKTWHVGEYKTHNAKSFREFMKKGVKESHQKHYAQMVLEMHLSDMKRAFYLAANKDTDELHSERIRYDKTESEALMERARRVITSMAPPDRISNRSDFYQCNWCDARKVCWGTTSPDPALPVMSLSCRHCCHATPIIERKSNDTAWKCEKKDRNFWREGSPCEDHLTLPGLLAFAEPTNAGDDFIEFESNDRTGTWKHGKGGFSSEDLTKLPAMLLTNKMVKDVKEVFKGSKIIDHHMTILTRYQATKTIWKGSVDSLEDEWEKRFQEKLTSLIPIARDDEPAYKAVEFAGGRIAVLWLADQTAEIREEK